MIIGIIEFDDALHEDSHVAEAGDAGNIVPVHVGPFSQAGGGPEDRGYITHTCFGNSGLQIVSRGSDGHRNSNDGKRRWRVPCFLFQ